MEGQTKNAASLLCAQNLQLCYLLPMKLHHRHEKRAQFGIKDIPESVLDRLKQISLIVSCGCDCLSEGEFDATLVGRAFAAGWNNCPILRDFAFEEDANRPLVQLRTPESDLQREDRLRNRCLRTPWFRSVPALGAI